MFKHKYIITVESESPPRICLGDSIHGATVIALETEQYPPPYSLTVGKSKSIASHNK